MTSYTTSLHISINNYKCSASRRVCRSEVALITVFYPRQFIRGSVADVNPLAGRGSSVRGEPLN